MKFALGALLYDPFCLGCRCRGLLSTGREQLLSSPELALRPAEAGQQLQVPGIVQQVLRTHVGHQQGTPSMSMQHTV